MKLVTDVKGRHWPMSKLKSLSATWHNTLQLTVAEDAAQHLGERVHDSKLAFVLSPRTLRRFGADSLESFVPRLQRVVSGRGHWRPFEGLKWVPLENFAGLFKDGCEVIEERRLTRQEKLLRDVLNSIAPYRVLQAFRSAGHPRRMRHFMVGASDVADAWTDGCEVIYINRKSLALIEQGLQGVAGMACLILHELCHDTSDQGTHCHGAEFYELFEQVSTMGRDSVVGVLIDEIMGAYGRAMRREGKRLSKLAMQAEDRVALSDRALPAA